MGRRVPQAGNLVSRDSEVRCGATADDWTSGRRCQVTAHAVSLNLVGPPGTACSEWRRRFKAAGTPMRLFTTVNYRPDERGSAFLNADICAIPHDDFFVRGCLEIPVHGQTESFICRRR